MVEDWSGWAWHVHHSNPILEWCFSYQERRDYILVEKPQKEHEVRLRWFTPVAHPELLPKAYEQAWQAYDQAWQAYKQAKQAYDQAWLAYKQAWQAWQARQARQTRQAYKQAWQAWQAYRLAYEQAWQAYDQAWQAYKQAKQAYAPQIEALHQEEHPDCPWDGKTIFAVRST